MKNIILPVLMILVAGIYCSNKPPTSRDSTYFEGVVTYKGSFVRKTAKYDSLMLALIAGDLNTLYVKEGNYLTIIGNGITTRLLYRKDENKSYRERFNSDTVFWSNCNKPGQKILDYSKRSKVGKILNIECDELKITYANKTVSYYYNSDTLKNNPEWFKNSTAYHEDFTSREMKAISLKTIIEYNDFTAVQTAIRIEPKKLDPEVFAIPKNKPMVEDE